MNTAEANQGASAEEKEIIAKLKHGEPMAITELYNTYVDRVYSMVLNRLDRDRDAAQDIVQETFLAASKSAGRFDGRSKVSTWLYSIAYKKIADFYRRRKREVRRQSEAQDNYAVEMAQSPGDEALDAGAVESERWTGSSRKRCPVCLPTTGMFFCSNTLKRYRWWR